MIVDDFVACCCSHCTVVSIVMSLKIMTEKCFLKELKTEGKSMHKNTETNNRLSHCDTA